MEDRELEIEVRRWLDHVLEKGSYNSGVLSSLVGLYYRGANDVRQDIKRLLDIQDCDHY